jgi:hypothetical protein
MVAGPEPQSSAAGPAAVRFLGGYSSYLKLITSPNLEYKKLAANARHAA